MAKYQAMHGEKFVTAVVMMLEDEDEGPQVSFEPFQVSDQCVKLYSEGWFHDEPAGTSVVHNTPFPRACRPPQSVCASSRGANNRLLCNSPRTPSFTRGIVDSVERARVSECT